jgi:hypothetical protein
MEEVTEMRGDKESVEWILVICGPAAHSLSQADHAIQPGPVGIEMDENLLHADKGRTPDGYMKRLGGEQTSCVFFTILYSGMLMHARRLELARAE